MDDGRTDATREPRAGRRRLANAVPVNDNLVVHDSWSLQVPISPREIETIEIYLGRILDELLRTHGVRRVGDHR